MKSTDIYYIQKDILFKMLAFIIMIHPIERTHVIQIRPSEQINEFSNIISALLTLNPDSEDYSIIKDLIKLFKVFLWIVQVTIYLYLLYIPILIMLLIFKGCNMFH